MHTQILIEEHKTYDLATLLANEIFRFLRKPKFRTRMVRRIRPDICFGIYTYHIHILCLRNLSILPPWPERADLTWKKVFHQSSISDSFIPVHTSFVQTSPRASLRLMKQENWGGKTRKRDRSKRRHPNDTNDAIQTMQSLQHDPIQTNKEVKRNVSNMIQKMRMPRHPNNTNDAVQTTPFKWCNPNMTVHAVIQRTLFKLSHPKRHHPKTTLTQATPSKRRHRRSCSTSL